MRGPRDFLGALMVGTDGEIEVPLVAGITGSVALAGTSGALWGEA
jgi:hypothetical protein